MGKEESKFRDGKSAKNCFIQLKETQQLNLENLKEIIVHNDSDIEIITTRIFKEE